MYTANALLFPHHVIPSLRDLRGPDWAALVDHVCSLPTRHEETLAFMLMMIHIDGCLTCETDSYRAMRGCTACAVQALRRFKGTDAELMAAYDRALKQVRDYAHAGKPLSNLIAGDVIPLEQVRGARVPLPVQRSVDVDHPNP